jgi:hypothetical protein
VYGQQKDEAELQGDEKKASTFVDKIRKIHLKVQEQLERSQQQYKSRHDNIEKIISFMLEIRCGFTSTRNDCKE